MDAVANQRIGITRFDVHIFDTIVVCNNAIVSTDAPYGVPSI